MSNELGGATLFDTLFVFQQVMQKSDEENRSDLWTPFELSDEPMSAQVCQLRCDFLMNKIADRPP